MTSTTAAADIPAPRRSHGLWGDALRRLARNRPAMFGAFLISFFVVVAVLAPVLAPFDPNKSALGPSLQPPSGQHLAGLDKLGRDVLSRVIYGARISLLTGVVSVCIAVLFGGVIGLLAGGIGGKVDLILMRVVDVLLAIPSVLLAIGIVAWLGQGLPQVMLAVAVANTPMCARVLRGSLLAVKAQEFVSAARSLGASDARVLLRHQLPNALTPLLVWATLALATAIIDVAILGFLGLGPPDPRTAEWGTMLTDGTELLRRAPHVVFVPSLLIVLSAVSFNLLGDGLRESLDPRLKR